MHRGVAKGRYENELTKAAMMDHGANNHLMLR